LIRDEPAGQPGRRRFLAGGAGLVALALARPQPASAATLLAVRVWPATAYTRVTLEHDSPLAFSHFMIRDSAPLRLVVDIEGLELTSTLRDLVSHVDADDPYIARVRVGQNRAHVVRLVFDLKADVRPQVFAVEPYGPYQHRLVLDLFPAEPQDAIAALLQGGQVRAPLNVAAAETSPVRPAEPPQVQVAEAPIPAPTPAPAPSAAAAPSAQPQVAAEPAPAPAAAGTSPPAAAESESEPAAAPTPRSRGGSGGRILTVAIDPGHGGEDPGAVGRRGTYEKNVTLSIGRQLAALIEAHPRMRVLLTRDSDFFVPLGQRVQKARRVQADLFVSIHADAWIKPTAHGSSVFALSERGATSSAAAWLARQQNEADLIGGVNLGTQDQSVARVLLDLSTTAQINDSLRFGASVLRELGHVNQLHRGQVEQAGFAVLKAPDIPSILVETAFISNPDEELRLKDDNYQRSMAQALLNGIRSYFAKHPPEPRNPVG